MLRFSDFHPNIRIKIITTFLTKTVSSMVFPFMAIFFAQKFGNTIAGLMVLANITLTIILNIYSGYQSDKNGRKRILIIGQIIQMVAYFFMAISNSPWFDSIWITYFMMNIISIAGGLTGPAADAMLIDVSTPESRKYMYSINYWSFNLSVAIGSLFGGLLFENHKFLLFCLLTIISLITLYLIIFYMIDVYKMKQNSMSLETKTSFITNYMTVIHDKKFILFCVGSILILSLQFQLNNYIGIRLSQEFQTISFSLLGSLKYDITGIRVLSFLTTQNTVLIVCLTLIISRCFIKSEDSKVLYIGLGIYTVGFSILGSNNTLSVLLIAGLFQTIGEILYAPVRQSLLAEVIPNDKRGSYIAINTLNTQIAKISGAFGIIIGAKISSKGMSMIYMVMGFTSIYLFYKVNKMMEKDRLISSRKKEVNL